MVVKPPNCPELMCESPGSTSKPSLHQVTLALGLLEADSHTRVVCVLALTSRGSEDTFTAAGGTGGRTYEKKRVRNEENGHEIIRGARSRKYNLNIQRPVSFCVRGDRIGPDFGCRD